MRRRTWLAGVVTAMLALILPTAPASAAPEIGLSLDGVTWAASLPGPLFDPAMRWVPGDSETASFYVRNQAGEAGVLDLTMLASAIHDLVDTGDLEISAQLDGGPFTSVTTVGPHLLIAGQQIAAGAVRKVGIRVVYAATSPNATQNKRLDLGFTVTLSQDPSVLAPVTDGGTTVKPPKKPNKPGNKPPGGLPNSGSVITPGMLLLAAALLASGAALVRKATRRAAPRERYSSHG